MGLQYSATISELLKAIRTIPFNLTIKDDKLSGVYEHRTTTTRIHYSSKHGYELYVIRGNVIEFSYITDKLINFTHCLDDVMKGVVTEVNHEEILQLKQRIVELEQLVNGLNKLSELGTYPIYGYGISSSDKTWKPKYGCSTVDEVPWIKLTTPKFNGGYTSVSNRINRLVK